MKKKKMRASVKDCVGCNDNFYNGNNQYGIKQCWLLESAVLDKRKEVGINDVPPWDWQPVVTVPECYRKRGYVYVGPTQLH